MDGPLHGVALRPLTLHGDARGSLAEVFRASWGSGVEPVQWNVLHSVAGAIRGPHLHPRHDDYLVHVSGRSRVGLRDLRPESPTAGRSVMIDLEDGAPVAMTIPHGVLHGFFYAAPTLQVVGVSCYFDPADELRCRYDDPALEMPWGAEVVHASAADVAAGTLADLVAELRQVRLTR